MPTISQSGVTDKVADNLVPQSNQQARQPFSAQPAFPSYSSFLATPLPLIATYQPDALRQFYRGGVPQQRIFPVQGG